MCAPGRCSACSSWLAKPRSGSKIERLPNFYASKRNDNAIVLSARYRPIQYVSIFAEDARYTWGLMASSATMLGLDPSRIIESLRTLLLRIWDMGFDAVRGLWHYLLLGAAIVVPIWLIVRLTRAAKGR